MISQQWADNSICRGSGEDFYGTEITEKMTALCGACPVRKECLSHALTYEAHGYWAGTTEQWRAKERQRLGMKQPFIDSGVARVVSKSAYELKPIEHNTERGYQAHQRRKIPFFYDGARTECGCQEAHRAYIKNYRAKKVSK
jgi:hypothetical protein